MERVSTVVSRVFSPTEFPNHSEGELEKSDSNGVASEERDELELNKSLSLVAPVPSKPIQEIPNGGLKAWLQVLGSFFLFFNTWGVTNAFGAFETYYVSSGYIKSSASDISIIGAVQAFFLLGFGLITGPLFDRGYFYHLIVVGSFLTVFGMMMTSLCTEYWQVLLAQGLCIGFGSGLLFVPSVAIMTTYFTSKKVFAVGIAASGASIGAIIYPITFHYVEPQLGYPWAVRIIAFIMLATLSCSISVMRIRMHTTEKKRIFDFAAFTEAPYSFFAVGTFFGFMGLYMPFFYISDFALSLDTFTPSEAFYLLIIMNGLSTLGRILPSYVADKIGPLNVMTPCAAAIGILAWCWIADSVKGGIVAFCCLYGFFSGPFVSLPPMVVVSLAPTLDVVGARMGMLFAILGCGLFIGEPVAGQILKSTGSYLGVQTYCASAVTLCVIGLVTARVKKAGWSLRVKA